MVFKKIYCLAALAALAFSPAVFVACSDGDGSDGGSESVAGITIADDQLRQSVAFDAATATVSFNAAGAWVASIPADASWVTISPAAGEAGDAVITVSLLVNQGEKRSVVITITCGGQSVEVSLTQDAKVEYSDGGREDVMLQAFYWDSQNETGWSKLKAKTEDIAKSFSCVWLPPSASAEGGGAVGGTNVGYHPRQWNNQTSCWGTSDDLKSLISSLHDGGVKVIADIVINHRSGDNAWGNFTADNFGEYGDFQLTAEHICADDEMNDPAQCSDEDWCGKATGADDTGENWGGARDLDHTSAYVQADCEAYLAWLKGDYGYDGWRYDFCKGYDGMFVGIYNDATEPYLSVGEMWDGSYDVVKAWIEATGFKSMAFDFPAKYSALNDGLAKKDFSKMSWQEDGSTWRPAGLIHHNSTNAYAVTFVDNHDTYRDDNKYKGDILQAYAFILSSPGVPCVFWPDWVNKNYKSSIEAMIAARKSVGLTNISDVKVTARARYYEVQAIGRRGSLICRIGLAAPTSAPEGYTVACQGSGWSFFIKK